MSKNDVEEWTQDDNKPKPLRIDINGIRLGKLIVVKREDLQKLSDWINRFPVDWDEFIRIKVVYEIE